jgi:hypothetical protein
LDDVGCVLHGQAYFSYDGEVMNAAHDFVGDLPVAPDLGLLCDVGCWRLCVHRVWRFRSGKFVPGRLEHWESKNVGLLGNWLVSTGLLPTRFCSCTDGGESVELFSVLITVGWALEAVGACVFGRALLGERANLVRLYRYRSLQDAEAPVGKFGACVQVPGIDRFSYSLELLLPADCYGCWNCGGSVGGAFFVEAKDLA